MAIEILMPALSPTMEEGNLANWLKKEGDKVKSGEVIAEIETDKAVMEVEATDAGTLGKILVSAGTNGVKVNKMIAVLLEDGDDASEVEKIIAKHSGASEKPQENAKPAEVQEEKPQKELAPNVKNDGGRVLASPLAKRIAEKNSVDISKIDGSGPNGRVIKKDVENVQSTQQLSPQVVQSLGRNSQNSTLVPHSNMRKVIAKRLLESKQTVPHFYVSVEASVKNLNKTRKQMNTYLEKLGEKISVNDLIVKACANALKVHPNVNASWNNDAMVIYNNVDISVAVGTDGGLITPIVKNADLKSLRVISSEMKDLIKRAKENKLSLEEFQGGGFSISNLGMYNVESFNAIINPPQSAIIAIGGVKSIAKVCKKTGGVCEDEVMTLTLSCDHRVIDGVLAAEFLNTVKSFVENPSLLVL